MSPKGTATKQAYRVWMNSGGEVCKEYLGLRSTGTLDSLDDAIVTVKAGNEARIATAHYQGLCQACGGEA